VLTLNIMILPLTVGIWGICTGGLVTEGSAIFHSLEGIETSPQLSPTRKVQISKGASVVEFRTTTISG